MSGTCSSVAQSKAPVNPRDVTGANLARVSISCVQLNARARAMLAQMTPEQIEAHNEHAAKLRAMSREIVEGPRVENGLIVIPSPCWESPAVACWKSHGGRFEKRTPWDVWKFSPARLSIERARQLYQAFFATVIERERIMLVQAEV